MYILYGELHWCFGLSEKLSPELREKIREEAPSDFERAPSRKKTMLSRRSHSQESN